MKKEKIPAIHIAISKEIKKEWDILKAQEQMSSQELFEKMVDCFKKYLINKKYL